MSPRELSSAVLHAKLRTIREHLVMLQELGDLSAERLAATPLERLAVERILIVLVEAAVGANSHVAAALLDRAPDSYRSSFDEAARAGAIEDELAARLGLSAGLRNLLVHRYDEIDVGLLAAAARQAAQDYREYVRQIARWLQSPSH